MIKFTRTVDYDSNGNPTVVTKEIGVGTTLFTRCNSERIMSDVWEWIESAYYWDSETSTLREMWLDNKDEVTIDGDFNSLSGEIEKAFFNRNMKKRLAEATNESMLPSVKGRTVKVVRGKTSKGAEGKVVVVMERPYGMGWRSSLEMKLGIALDDEMTTYVAKNGKTYPTHKNMIWVWARNCEVVNPEVDFEKAKSYAISDTSYEMNSLKNNISSSVRKREVALA